MKNTNQIPGLSAIWERFRLRSIPIETIVKFYESDFYSSPHMHDFVQIWYCAEGEYTHTVDGTEHKCIPGSLLIVPSGNSHSFEILQKNNCKLYQINLLFNLFDNFNDESTLRAASHTFLQAFSDELKFEARIHTVFHDTEKDFIDNIFNMLCEYETSKSSNSLVSYRNLFCSIFSLPCFALSEKSLSYSKKFIENKFIPLLKTMYFMNINYGRKITRNELVELSGLCQTDYFRYIKGICGSTFSIYLQRIRVRHAITLATFSPYSLSYIANTCGFGDLTYMENRIKKFSTGTHSLPSEMRKERKNYIKTYPHMIMTRTDYEKLSEFFYSYGL